MKKQEQVKFEEKVGEQMHNPGYGIKIVQF